MEDWCILTIQNHKRGNMDVYRKTLKEVFGQELSWSEVKQLSKENQRRLLITLKNNIAESNSPLAISKLARAILSSRSGIGGSAMTKYKCAFCGEEEIWGSTAVPNICGKCAFKMAENIVIHGYDVFKDEIN